MKLLLRLTYCATSFFMSILFHAPEAKATAQKGETIIYNGDTLQMLSEPLEPYLRMHEPREKFYPLLKDGCSTALWRGYIGDGRYQITGYTLLIFTDVGRIQ